MNLDAAKKEIEERDRAQQRRDDLLEVVAIHAAYDLGHWKTVLEPRLDELTDRLWPSPPDARCPPGEKKLVE